MGEISKPASLIGRATKDVWADPLYFPRVQNGGTVPSHPRTFLWRGP
jgi:hypothetical protein